MFTFSNFYVLCLLRCVQLRLVIAKFSNSYDKWRLRYVMLRFLAVPRQFVCLLISWFLWFVSSIMQYLCWFLRLNYSIVQILCCWLLSLWCSTFVGFFDVFLLVLQDLCWFLWLVSYMVQNFCWFLWLNYSIVQILCWWLLSLWCSTSVGFFDLFLLVVQDLCWFLWLVSSMVQDLCWFLWLLILWCRTSVGDFFLYGAVHLLVSLTCFF